MTVIFNKEPDCTLSCLSFDVVWKGFEHQELYWADIVKALGAFMVRWNDDYRNPVHCDSEESARQHVIDNYSRHNPHSNGLKFEIK